MTYEILEIDGRDYPIRFGFNALREYSKITGSTMQDLNKLAKFKVLKGKATNQADIDYLNNQIEYLELKSTNSFAAQRLLRNKRKQAKIDQEAGKTLTRYQKQILGLD